MNAQNPHGQIMTELASETPIVEIKNVAKSFALKGKTVVALAGIDLSVTPGGATTVVNDTIDTVRILLTATGSVGGLFIGFGAKLASATLG